MRKFKFIFAFFAIGILLSACEFSPEEIEPVGEIMLETDPGTSGEHPDPTPPPRPPGSQ